MALNGPIFTRKSYNNQLYKWSPIPFNKKINKTLTQVKSKGPAPTPISCTALPGSQGEDFTETYVYDLVIIGGVEHRYAYVECDYVQ